MEIGSLDVPKCVASFASYAIGLLSHSIWIQYTAKPSISFIIRLIIHMEI